MSVSSKIFEYRRLRDGTAWRHLASPGAPVILGILGEHFGEGGLVGASALHEMVRRDLDELSAKGIDKGFESLGGAQSYISQWLAAGYLERRFLPGEREEQYELSLPAVSALRLAETMARPRTAATESRLGNVVSLVLKLEEETDPNPESRIATLESEKARIEARIGELRSNSLGALDDARATERAREVIALAEELTGDFLRVGAEFERLNRDLRHTLVESDLNRGDVLETLFASVDMIADSDAGRAFNGFYRLLMDEERREVFEAAIEEIFLRGFAAKLSEDDRSFLASFTDLLLDRGGRVHATQLRLARSLRDFVRSRDYLEKRRITTLLVEAEQGAVALRDSLQPLARLEIGLDRTSSEIRSVGQLSLYDPAMAWRPTAMADAADADIDPDEIAQKLLGAEIDYRALKDRIRDALASRDQVSIGDILKEWPAEQGLGSVVGLIDLGFRFGLAGAGGERVGWSPGGNGTAHATIPLMYFTKERIDEFE